MYLCPLTLTQTLMEFFIKAAQLLTSLSILVILHEMGHFFPARWFKTRVEKFYLFFNPGFSLFRWKKVNGAIKTSWFSKKPPKEWDADADTTEMGLGWLPLGGYVKISGMVDESMDSEQMKQPAQPWEFRSKPAWQRLIIMVGGVTVNLILGILLYTMILFVWGEKVLPISELKNGVWCISPVAEDLGFKNGDKIISVRGESPESFGDLMPLIIYSGEVKVKRGSEEITLTVPEDVVEKITDSGTKTLFYPRVPFIIDNVPDSSINSTSGLQNRDKLISIAGTPVQWFDEAKQILRSHAGNTVACSFERSGQIITLNLAVSDSGLFEIKPLIPDMRDMEKAGLYSFDNREYGFFESVPAGLSKAWGKLTGYVEQFKLIFNPATGAYKSLGGFGRIGGMFPAQWEWQAFWEITAILSLILAFMNILPIPALDGGHVMFLLYEMIVGRPPGQKFLEKAQMVGMIFLLLLLVYANGNDIIHWFQGKL